MVVTLSQKCPNCNNNLKPNTSFCPNCGYHITNNSNIGGGNFDFSDDFSFAVNNDFSDDFNYESDEVSNEDFDYEDSIDVQLDDFDYDDSKSTKLDDFTYDNQLAADDFKYEDISENLDFNNKSSEFDDFSDDFTFTSDSNKDEQHLDMNNKDTIDLFDDFSEDNDTTAHSYTESSQKSQNVYESDFTSSDFSFGEATFDDVAEESIQNDTTDNKTDDDAFDFTSSDFSFDEKEITDTADDLIYNDNNHLDEKTTDFTNSDFSFDELTDVTSSKNEYSYNQMETNTKDITYDEVYGDNTFDEIANDFSFDEAESAQDAIKHNYHDSITIENDDNGNYDEEYSLEESVADFEFADKTDNNNYSDDLFDTIGDEEYDKGSGISAQYAPSEKYDYVDDFRVNNRNVDYDENISQMIDKYDSNVNSSLIDIIIANQTIILIIIIIILLIIIIIDHI